MPTTITVDDETLERFKRLKAELDGAQADVPDHTNESFLQALMDEWEAESYEVGEDWFEVADDEVVIYAPQSDTARELADRIGDGMGDADPEAFAREVARQFDYAALADEVARRVVEEMGR